MYHSPGATCGEVSEEATNIFDPGYSKEPSSHMNEATHSIEDV